MSATACWCVVGVTVWWRPEAARALGGSGSNCKRNSAHARDVFVELRTRPIPPASGMGRQEYSGSGYSLSYATISTGERSAWTCTMASSNPAAKLASNAHKTWVDCMQRAAMVQLAAAALCTELVNRVGEMSRSACVKLSKMAWMLCPSALDEQKTQASSLAGRCAAALA